MHFRFWNWAGVLLATSVLMAGCKEKPAASLDEFVASHGDSGQTDVLAEVPIPNANFEDWRGANPLYWMPLRGNLVYMSSDYVYEGKLAAGFIEKNDYNWLEQTYEFDGTQAPGKELWLSAMAQAWDPGRAGVSMIVEGFSEFFSENHPGDGEWHEVKIGCRLPAYWAGGKVTVKTTVASKPQNRVFFDNVRLVLR